jgi:hypothetical protein
MEKFIQTYLKKKIITKAPLNWTTSSIIENFISYRVINTILENNILVNNM